MATPNFVRLNSKIKAAGADWIAGETPYSKFHGTKPKSGMFGLAMTPEMAFGALSASRTTEQAMMAAAPPKLPKKIDWRHYNGKNFVTPIKDQGTCGACVAFATVATVEARVLIQQNKPGAKINLSEANLFYCGTPNSCELGWQPAHALNFAVNPGLGEETAFPYTPGNQSCKVIPPVVKVTQPSVAATTLARKQALQKGPAVASMAVYDDFFSYKSGVYRHIVGNLAGYHAVCVVGYDDTAGCWIVKNSWNTTWGDSGFFRIRYGECGIDTQFPFNFPADVVLQPGKTV